MEPNNIWEIFFSLENPAIYAAIFTLIIIALTLLITQKFIHPLSKRKRKLELENAKLAALYSEIDPDPIIRVDENWKPIDMNNAAKEIFNTGNGSLQEFISKIKSKNEEKDGSSSAIKIKTKYYSSITKDVDDLKFKHIYLHDITNRIEGEQKIKNYKDNLRELRTKLESVNEELKQKIGTELHDSVGHSLSLLKIQLQNVLETKELNTDEDEIKKVFISIDELSQEVRELSHELRPRILEEFGLIQAIASLIDRTNLQGNMKGYIVQNKEFRITEKKLEKNIYRICKEALNNIIKHSECSEFYLEFNLDNSILGVVISDNGKGFDLNEQFGNERSSLGLFNMKEGVEAVGGTFNIDSIKDIGTNISLKFKIIEEEND